MLLACNHAFSLHRSHSLTLLRTMLGDFDFEPLQYSNRVFGGLNFSFFVR